jgi:hypothetical protein
MKIYKITGKFRLHRCSVVGEKDLKEIGLAGEADV